MTSPLQCRHVLATDFVDASASIQPLFLELYLLQRPIEDIKKKTYHLHLLAQVWRSLQNSHILFHSLLHTASHVLIMDLVLAQIT